MRERRRRFLSNLLLPPGGSNGNGSSTVFRSRALTALPLPTVGFILANRRRPTDYS